MSWHRTGTVAVTNGSKTVTGVGTLWTTAVNVGDAFALVDANLNPTGAWYEVDVVVSNTEITLKQSYAGTTGSNNQYCVFNMVGNMTTPSFAQRLATFFASFQSLIDKPTTTPTAASIPIADANGDIESGWIKNASATVRGVVELATSAEAIQGTDTERAMTPSTSGTRVTFAATSTDDATSTTAAPLKTAGGLAVAKNARIAQQSSINRQLIDGFPYVISNGKTARILVTSATTNVSVAGGIDISGRTASSGAVSAAAWRIYGNLSSAGSLFSFQLHKTVAEYITISTPTWLSTTEFYIDITNANIEARSFSICININLSSSGTSALTLTYSTLE